MTKYSCGIDFGTSNSALGVFEENELKLIEFEEGRTFIPSAVFFNYETMRPSFGSEAILDYALGAEGRLVRSLKSMLGTSLIEERTSLKTKSLSYKDILVIYLKHLKETAEQKLGGEIVKTVAGRPVFFCDNDEIKDKKAENTLEQALREAGFKDISFEYEPIAAAYDYQQSLEKKELAVIVDIGGGTSDFSVIRLDSKAKSEVLANSGVHIGGTDFDKFLSLKYVMPSLGYGSDLKGKSLPFPSIYFHSLSTWHLINQLYTDKSVRDLKSLLINAKEPSKIRKLLAIIEDYQGHALNVEIEKAKIKLSTEEKSVIDLFFVKSNMQFEIFRQGLEAVIVSMIDELKSSLNEALVKADSSYENIDVVFFAGGSSHIPVIRKEIMTMFKNAKEASNDLLNSVVKGLVIKNRF